MADILAHSKIGASSMERWMNCPGSVRLSEGMPSISSAYADEGTLAHEIAAAILCDQPHKNASDEMMDAVNVYVDFVRSLVDQNEGATLLVEHRLDLSHLRSGLFGTADCIIYAPKTKTLHVIDYKHGQGLPVEVVEDGKPNVQLTYYGLGALEATKYPCLDIVLTVVQPRCSHPDGPVRSYSFPAVEMIEFAADLVEYAKATEDQDAKRVPGDWCRFCPAAVKCPEIKTRALSIAKNEFSPTLSYDPKKLSETLEWLDVFEGFLKNVRAFAYAEAERGRVPPGWKLVEKRATRKWRDEDLVSDIVRQKGLDLFDQKLKSVAQAEKFLGKDVFLKELSELVVQESSGLALVPVGDKRPPAKRDARSEFTPLPA
jgi:hypothetical protein